jgi:hypothetical protein
MAQQDIKDESIYNPSGTVNLAKVDIGLQGSTIAIILGFTIVIGACGLVMGLNLSKQSRQDEDMNALRRQYERTFIVVTDLNAEVKAKEKSDGWNSLPRR